MTLMITYIWLMLNMFDQMNRLEYVNPQQYDEVKIKGRRRIYA